MRRYILIILALYSSVSFAQPQPDKYTLSPGLFTGANTNGKNVQRIIPTQIAEVVTPTQSRTPISNSITDMMRSQQYVWLGTGKGLMRTTDFNSFDVYYKTPLFGEDGVSALAVYENFIIAATATTEIRQDAAVQVGTGIKISTDGGVNWTSYPQPLDNSTDTVEQYGNNRITALPVTVAQQNVIFDIAVSRRAGNPIIWITSWSGGLRKSTNLGATWQRVVTPPDNLDSITPSGTYNFSLRPKAGTLGSNNHLGFSIFELNDSTIFYGSANGINKSTDYGVSWRKYNYQNTEGGISGNFVVALKLQSYNNGTRNYIWAASRQADDIEEFNAYSYSSDGGATWNNTLEGNFPYNLSFKDSIVYAYTYNGLWRGVTGPFNWSKAPVIYDEQTKDKLVTEIFYSGVNTGDTLYIGSNDGLLRTRELGQPWIGKWKIYRSIDPISYDTEIKTYAAPNPFSPDDEVVRIFYKTNKSSPATVTIKIFDFGMNPVRTVIQNASRNSVDELFTQWDGKNDNGGRVANGVYFYRIKIDDSDETWGKILVIQ